MNLPAKLAFAVLVGGAALPAPASSQSFVRVTDPANPIVTDTYQSGGGCFVDLVGDGYLDLFVANGNLSNQPNALYRNTRTGGFVKVVTGPVVGDGGSSIGGTFGDYDNDGLLDLFVTNRNNFGNFLYRGLGDTLFSKVTTSAPVSDIANSNSGSWVDLDNDGNLDLYVVNFAQSDFLYRNGGGPGYGFGRVDTTAATPGGEFSIPGAWGDFNNDGRADLFVGNAGNQNDYLHVNHGQLSFTRTVLEDGLTTLGASWGDYDNDGNLDLFVAHFLGQKNTLHRNSGPPGFQLVPVTGIVSNESGQWVGSAWGDYDNDGSLDLFVAQDGGPGALYHNDGPPAYGFTKITTGPVSTDAGNAFGAVWGDYDRDGQLDLFVSDRLGAGNRLYHNQGTPHHWLTVRCVGTASNRTAIGARVRVYTTIAGTPRWQHREVAGQTGYNSQNLDQHFGLGDAATVDLILVRWPSGHEDAWRDVPADQLLQLHEGAGTLMVEPPAGAPGDGHLQMDAPRPNPCRGEANVRYRLPSDGSVRLEVFDVGGRRVATTVDRWLPAGAHSTRIALPAGLTGISFCRLRAGDQVATVRLVVLP